MVVKIAGFLQTELYNLQNNTSYYGLAQQYLSFVMQRMNEATYNAINMNYTGIEIMRWLWSFTHLINSAYNDIYMNSRKQLFSMQESLDNSIYDEVLDLQIVYNKMNEIMLRAMIQFKILSD